MYGIVYVNFVVSECDLLIVVGVCFDDWVIGKLDEFVSCVKVIYIDIDLVEVGKNRVFDVFIVGDVCYVLEQFLQWVWELDYFIYFYIIQVWLNCIDYWWIDYFFQVFYYEDIIVFQEVVYEIGCQVFDVYYIIDVG